ncbi:MAG: 2-oxoacid:acceptor oxidoreductase family protein [Chloroflexota bacterium]|nr:2-oxoacid:acceptor oxidoreductase family protein [Chloroflexota bacterium]
MKRVIISGEGGQGVRVISHALAILMMNLDYHVSLLYDYDSSVRGAMSLAYLTFNDNPIDNPVIEDADILLKLSDKATGFSAEKIVCETGLCTDEEVAFGHLGWEKFGNEIFGNMIALGRLIRLVDLDLSDKELAKVLPLKYREENIKAVHVGYDLKQEDLDRGRLSRRKHISSSNEEDSSSKNPAE